jgi:hypothetical protein
MTPGRKVRNLLEPFFGSKPVGPWIMYGVKLSGIFSWSFSFVEERTRTRNNNMNDGDTTAATTTVTTTTTGIAFEEVFGVVEEQG